MAIKAPRFLPDARFRRAERRVEAFRQGVECTPGDGALLTVLLYSAIQCLLLMAGCWCLGQGFPEVNLSTTDVIIFLGLVAFGSVIQRPGVGGGVQVGFDSVTD